MDDNQLHDIGMVSANAMSKLIIARIEQKHFAHWTSDEVAEAIVNAYRKATDKAFSELVK